MSRSPAVGSARPAGALSSAGFVLNVYKEVGWTSHDAVGRIRRILGERAVGHAGTLDPLAAGVLVVGVGRATKLLPYLTELPKEYRGTMLLGRKTSTGDLGGETIAEATVPSLELTGLRGAANEFLGRGLQTPPMVSAVKHEGRRLYELARKGISVERAPRAIEIRRFDIVAAEPPRVDFEVECSRGTYVRTLVEDFAEKLGTLGTVEALVRSRVGSFSVEWSTRLISRPGSEAKGLETAGIPMGEALAHLPAARLDRMAAERLRHGGVPPRSAVRYETPPTGEGLVRLLSPEEDLLGVGRLELLPGPADRPLSEALGLRLERVL